MPQCLGGCGLYIQPGPYCLNCAYKQAKGAQVPPINARIPWSYQSGASTPRTTTSSNCRIWWDPSASAYRLTVPYRQEFPAIFKACVSYGDYNWDSNAKIWTFVEKYFTPVKDLVQKIYGSVQTISRTDWETANAPKAATQTTNANGTQAQPNAGYIPPLNVSALGADSVLVQFVRMLPYEALKKSYLHGAMMFHPDRPGGNAEKQQQLNLLWQRIEKEIYQK